MKLAATFAVPLAVCVLAACSGDDGHDTPPVTDGTPADAGRDAVAACTRTTTSRLRAPSPIT